MYISSNVGRPSIKGGPSVNDDLAVITKELSSGRIPDITTRSLELTSHAVRQAQNRGILSEAISLVVQFGHRERDRLGRFRRTVRRREAKRLRELRMVSPNLMDKVTGVTVITKEESSGVVVITVLPRNARRRVRSKRRSYQEHKYLP
jgi:hypothetical protein